MGSPESWTLRPGLHFFTAETYIQFWEAGQQPVRSFGFSPGPGIVTNLYAQTMVTTKIVKYASLSHTHFA